MRNWINNVQQHIKNIPGWRTERKLVAFSVDDYGSVRIDSVKARRELDRSGVPALNRFDRFDALETREDLERLYEVLRSVTDKNGKYAKFTAFTLPCNIDFEKVLVSGDQYSYELLPDTFLRLSGEQPKAYQGAWEKWQEGMENDLIIPQFHGREHLHVGIFEQKLQDSDAQLMALLKNRSYTSLPVREAIKVSNLAAFDFWEFNENDAFHDLIIDGLNRFGEVFGNRAVHFTPPVYRYHPVLNSTLKENGISMIDTALVKQEHQGEGNYKRKFSYTGKRSAEGLLFLVRNVVFEPTEERGIDWVTYSLNQIEAAFLMKKPAIISSHRVNFSGHIDPGNREKGLGALSKLLGRITERWPEVEFMAANELGDLIKMKVD